MTTAVLPRTGPCAPWISAADVAEMPGCRSIANGILAAQAMVASEILYALSAQQFTGPCGPVTVRPEARPVDWDTRAQNRLFAAGYQSSWGTCTAWGTPHGASSSYGCTRPPEIELGAYPITKVTLVKITGVIIPPNEYYLQDYRVLIRLRPALNATPTQRWGWPTCFPAGVMVTTERGQIPVEQVVEGDRVLTHRGRWRRVTWSGQTDVAETVTIRGQGAVLRCTSDHRLWTSELHGTRAPYKLGSPEWTAARSAVGSAWAVPSSVQPLPLSLPDGWTSTDLPANFWWLIGRWLGDGWTEGHRRPGRSGSPDKDSTGVLVCCGHHEADALQAHLAETGWHWARKDVGRGVRFRRGDKALHAWLRREFGTRAHNKQIPAWLLAAPVAARQEFLAGYVSADGWERPRGTSVHTVSKAAAVGLRILLATLGYAASVFESKAASGSGYNARQPYRVDWGLPAGGPRAQSWVDRDHLWTRVRAVTLDPLAVPVYDIEVEEDHSFVADGVVVHNCQMRTLPDTTPGTFSVTYTYGVSPPTAGKQAAAWLAGQLAKAYTGSPNVLPSRITSMTREGMSIQVADSMDFLKEGLTGFYSVDLFLRTVNPSGLRHKPIVWSPDIGKPKRMPPQMSS